MNLLNCSNICGGDREAEYSIAYLMQTASEQQITSYLLQLKNRDPNFNLNTPINQVNISFTYDQLGDTILHYASYKSYKEVIKFCKRYGVNSSASNFV